MKKRADGRYQKAVTIKGKKHIFYGKTVAEINKKILAFQEKEEKGKLFAEVAEQWYYSIVDSISPTTVKGYKPAKNNAIAEFGEMYLCDITAMDISRYLEKFKLKGSAYKTVLTKLQIVRQVFDFAILRGYANNNPANVVKVPTGLKRTKREAPEFDVVDKIKNSNGNTFSLFALIGLYTGCRRGEILALQYEDFDFENNTINICKSVYHEPNKAYIKQPKTQSGKRVLPLLEPLKAIVQPLKIKGYLFTDNGVLLSNQQAVTLWEHYCKETNIKLTPHQLRHAYATRLYEL